jgi:hypothetical protein
MTTDEDRTENARRMREWYARRRAEGMPSRKSSRVTSCTGCGKRMDLKSCTADKPRCQDCRQSDRRAVCSGCGDPYTQLSGRPGQKYCSTACRDSAPPPPGLCKDCGTPTPRTSWRGIALCDVCRPVRAAALKERQRLATIQWRKDHPEHDRDKARRRRALKLDLPVERYTTEEIAERDGYRCGICRGPVDMTLSGLDDWGPTVDHVTALVNGGHDVRSNVQLAHRICNTKKGAR